MSGGYDSQAEHRQRRALIDKVVALRERLANVSANDLHEALNVEDLPAAARLGITVESSHERYTETDYELINRKTQLLSRREGGKTI